MKKNSMIANAEKGAGILIGIMIAAYFLQLTYHYIATGTTEQAFIACLIWFIIGFLIGYYEAKQ